MALKNFNPRTPGQRQLVLVDRSGLWKGGPVKELTEGLNKKGGRNNHGRITVRRRGGGHKRRYRVVDFKRTKFDVAGTVERIEYDPNRSAFIALIRYEDGEQAYILAPQRLAEGDSVIAGERADIKPGNAMPMKNIPVGTSFTMSSSSPAKVGSWHVPLAPTCNSSARTRAMPCCALPRASSVWCGRTAWPLLVPFPTRITRTRTWARRAVPVGKVAARAFAVLR